MEKLLGVEEVAGLLGVSRFTIYSWAAKRRLPAVKVGSRLMFRPSEIRRWVDSRSQPADGSGAPDIPPGQEGPSRDGLLVDVEREVESASRG
jgi:excisionase family DNA binding protein